MINKENSGRQTENEREKQNFKESKIKGIRRNYIFNMLLKTNADCKLSVYSEDINTKVFFFQYSY